MYVPLRRLCSIDQAKYVNNKELKERKFRKDTHNKHV